MTGASLVRARWTRVAFAVVVGALVVMWLYVLFIAKPDTGDRLADRTFPTAAEPVCADAVAQLQQAGLVNQHADSPAARADLVDRGDAILADMVARLRTLTPPTGESHDAVAKWLDDWDQWLRDRAAWSTRLHDGQDAAFVEKQRDNGDPNSKALNAFAIVNDMSSCQTPVGI